MSKFSEMYAARVAAGKRICIGLDPDLSKIPACVLGVTDARRVLNFLIDIVNATHEYAAAYKPQSAFFEELGRYGMGVLQDLIAYIRLVDATIPIILDYKRGDIGNTNRGYVGSAFDFLGVDAITVHPYLGMEAMKPFLDQPDKLIIVLCRTSNPGAGEFQDVLCTTFRSSRTGKYYSTLEEAAREGEVEDTSFLRKKMPLYQLVAYRVAHSWNTNGNCAVVVGATYPDELKLVREIVGDLPILIPGLGSQGGKIEDVIPGGLASTGWGVILNNASAINFAFTKIKGDGGELKYTPEQYILAASEAAKTMNDAVGAALVA